MALFKNLTNLQLIKERKFRAEWLIEKAHDQEDLIAWIIFYALLQHEKMF